MENLSTGTLLIAEPFLKDPSFMRTVVLLCKHTAEEGTFGFTLNKLADKNLNDLVTGLEPFYFPVYMGGPVQTDTLHYLHTYPQHFPDCMKVAEGVYWGGDFDLLKSLIWDGKIEQENVKFFLGYSGWSAGQLATEMEQHSWLTVEGNKKLIMETSYEDIWKESLNTLGGEYKSLANYPIDPQLN